MRVLVAARLSRKVDDKSQTGLESQDSELLKWAEREGHEIVHVAADFKSGTTHPWNRPNLRPWVTEPPKIAQYDAVVAYRLDRLSRGDDRSTSMIETWAYENRKQLVTEDGLRFPCEGADGIRWDVTKRIAHEEWLKISERYKRMRAYLQGSGYHVGRAPYGYRSVVAPGDNHKTLAIVPEEADVIRDAAAWYLGGLSLEDICAKLNGQGRVRTRKNGHALPWVRFTLSKFLHNEVIAGRQRNGKGETIAKVPPILSREIWTAVQDQLAERTKRSGISQSRLPAMLTSILMCTACSKAMYRGAPDHRAFYFCRVKGCKSRIRVTEADAWIDETMRSDNRRDIVEVIVRGDGYETEIADVKRDIAEAVEAEKFDLIPALRAELERLRALPASPTRVERRESDQTVAEMWAAMAGDTERRAYLLERGARVEYAADESGAWLTCNLGQPQTL